jgi:excisionase family DNA binding protein
VNLPSLPDKDLLRPDEVADFFSVSKRVVYKWCEEGKLDSTLVGGSTLRVFRASVLKLIKQGKDLASEVAPKAAILRTGRRVLNKGVR